MNTIDINTVINAFRSALLSDLGYAPDEVIPDGQGHRFSTNGKKGNKDGRYILHLDGFKPAGYYECLRQGIKQRWKYSDTETKLTPEQRKQLAQQIAATKRANEQRLEAQYIQASSTAYRIWDMARHNLANQTHPYLWRKMCLPYGLGLDEYNNLVMPLSDAKGNLWSIQRISAKPIKDNKKLLSNAKKRGMFYVLNCPIRQLAQCHTCYVGEGFATVSTYAQVFLQLQLGEIGTGHAVVCAVDAGNLEPVIQGIYQEYPHLKFVIIADDDRLKGRQTGKNAGKDAASAIAAKYPYVRVQLPPFPPNAPLELSDFNDLYVWEQKTQGERV